MVMTKPPVAPIHIADMGRSEAEQVTQAIKNNFDSLGAMLAQARDRRAYKALGYRSFEAYCRSEFGKSVSSAYQLIEDAHILAQLEAKISEEYGEDITLKFPSSHLKPLKEIDNIDDKLKAIEYAQKLATAENRKATKKDLEIAVFQISGKRSEDFRAAIQDLGFTRGVQVEAFKSLNKDRGFVTKIDKGGKIYVEFHYGGNAAIPYDAADLRILSEDEQPAQPLNADIASKGDRVLIFSPALKGKEGTIFQWKSGKQALVMVDGRDSPIDVAYAEMEAIKKTEEKNANWESELVWESGKNTYYYFCDPQTKRITSNLWPLGLTLEPSELDIDESKNPIKFMKHWEEDFAGKVLESLASPARVKTLALAQALDLPEQQGREFAADLIASLLQLFPAATPKPITQKALGISFSKTINELVSGKKTQTRRTWQDDYAKSFIRYFEEGVVIPALDKGRHRGGHELGFIKLTQRPYQQYLSEMTATDLQEEGGMVATAQEFIDTFFEGQNKLVWVLHFEFLPSRSDAGTLLHENERLRKQLLDAETTIKAMIGACAATAPRDTAAPADFLVENSSEISSPGDTAAHTDLNANSWREILEANRFVPVPYGLKGFFKGSWRGWKFFFHAPNGGVIAIDIANEKEEMFTRCTEVNFDIDLGDEDKIIEWVKRLINEIEDFCPGQLSLFSTPDMVSVSREIEIEEKLSPEVNKRLEDERKKATDRIRDNEFKKHRCIQLTAGKPNKKEIEQLDRSTADQHAKLQDLKKFSEFRVGTTICHKRDPLILGKIIKLEFSQGGMPLIWVKYFRDGELEKTPTSELVNMIFAVEV